MDKYLKVNFVPGPNMGDKVFPYMLRKMNVPFAWTHHMIEKKIISTGSIIGVAAKKDTIVWGSGIITSNTIPTPEAIYMSVRGKVTRALIKENENILMGDPAMALPYFYNPDIQKKHKVGIIPHVVDYDVVRNYMKKNPETFKDATLINPCVWEDGIEPFIDHVLSCERVVSTCLHGLITSHAYGIPAAWWRVGDRLIGDDIKFVDHYSSMDKARPIPNTTYDDIKDESFFAPSEKVRQDLRDSILNSSPLFILDDLDDDYFTTTETHHDDCYTLDYKKSGKKFFDLSGKRI